MEVMGCLVEREEEEGDIGDWSWCFCCWNGGGDGGERGGGVGGENGGGEGGVWVANRREQEALWLLVFFLRKQRRRRSNHERERRMWGGFIRRGKHYNKIAILII